MPNPTYEHVVYPLSTLPPEQDAVANRHLAASFEETVKVTERAKARMQLETRRAKKMQADVKALFETRRTSWYQRWARQVDRNKSTPAAEDRKHRINQGG